MPVSGSRTSGGIGETHPSTASLKSCTTEARSHAWLPLLVGTVVVGIQILAGKVAPTSAEATAPTEATSKATASRETPAKTSTQTSTQASPEAASTTT